MASSNSNNFPDETMKQKLNSSIMTRFGCLYILRELGTNSIFECLLPLLKTQFQFTAQIHQIFGQSPADVHLISGVSKLEGLFLASENHSTFNNHKFFQELMKNPNILTQKIGGRSKIYLTAYLETRRILLILDQTCLLIATIYLKTQQFWAGKRQMITYRIR